MDLTVADLGDDVGNNGLGGGLNLAVTDLGDRLSSSSGSLDLAVTDLGGSSDGGGDSTGGSLDLTVANLGGFGLSSLSSLASSGSGSGGRGSGQWVDGNTEGASVVGGGASKGGRWGQSGPWFGRNVSSNGVTSQGHDT